MSNNRKKILIIGGTGFIGRNLRQYLEVHTSHQILAPTRGELNLFDDQACKKYLSKELPDYVIHSAVDIYSAENTLRIFFNIYNEYHSYGTLIQLGSGAEYDKRFYVPLMDEQKFGVSVPTDTYGLAKYLIARELKTSTNKNAINLRLFGIFGKGEDFSRRFISNNICRALAGLPISLNKDMRFDYIDVDDLGRLIVDLLSRDSLVLGDYNFCTGSPLHLKEIGDLICKEMGQEEPIVVKQEGFNIEYSGNPGKLFSNIGDFNFTPIRESIKNLADYYRENMSFSDLMSFKAISQ